LVIENTFTDMPTVARGYTQMWLLELTCRLGIPGLYYLAPILCSEKWRSINLMPRLGRLPVLFLAGEKDEVIPPNHMRELYEVCKYTPSKGIRF
jgi:fermentation-respiration switch protein FrsA (DUF1100 family)